MRGAAGSVAVEQLAYFDCPEEVVPQIEQEIRRVSKRKSAIEITEHDRGVHDRGFRYLVYRVSSRRLFDSDVDSIAWYLDTLAHHLFAAMCGHDASRWYIEAFDDQCYTFNWSTGELLA